MKPSHKHRQTDFDVCGNNPKKDEAPDHHNKTTGCPASYTRYITFHTFLKCTLVNTLPYSNV